MLNNLISWQHLSCIPNNYARWNTFDIFIGIKKQTVTLL